MSETDFTSSTLFLPSPLSRVAPARPRHPINYGYEFPYFEILLFRRILMLNLQNEGQIQNFPKNLHILKKFPDAELQATVQNSIHEHFIA